MRAHYNPGQTRYAWPPFPRPVGPLRAVCPSTGRTVQLGDRVRHLFTGTGGTVEGIGYDGFTGTCGPYVQFDDRPHVYLHTWTTVRLDTPH